ncbi:MAG: CRTAC1 family protein [Planctomycetota bacterium]
MLLSHTQRSLALLAATALTGALGAQSFVNRSAGLGGPRCGTDGLFFGSGAAVADFDNDGDLDIVSSQNLNQQIRIWENTGNFNFIDRTSGSNLGIGNAVRGMAVADVDNDGDLDLLVTEWRQQSHLFINQNGGFIFVDEAAARGLTTITSKFTAAFTDYNKDGWVDIAIGNRVTAVGANEPNELWLNQGDGTFQNVAATTGADLLGLSFATVWVDYDEDGWPDIYVANDKGPTLSPNQLLHNSGNGSFTPAGALTGADIAVDGMGLDYADVFNDGGVDLYCSDTPSDHHFLRWDPATSTYVDDAYSYGMECGPLGWTVKFEDFDNDSWTDLFVNHVSRDHYLLLNPAQPASANAAWNILSVSGTNLLVPPPTSTLAFNSLTGDLDNDGDIDLLCRWQGSGEGLSIYENVLPGTLSNNWLRFDVEGTRSGTDAFGTRVEVSIGSQVQRDWKKAGAGYLSQCDDRVHFGLGTATQVDRVEITWPTGQKQLMFDVPANQTITIREPQLAVAGDNGPIQVTLGVPTPIDFESNTDGGLTYAYLLSATQGPAVALPDGNVLPLGLDPLTTAALLPGNALLSNSVGNLSPTGDAQATLTAPTVGSLIGVQLFTTAVTFDPTNVPLLRTVINEAFEITLQ